jgi:group I intron endonuclease
MTCGVYLLTSPSGKRYVGSSEKVERRYREHRARAVRGEHPNPALARSFLKYGELDLAVLEECEPELLVVREQAHIDALQPELNVSTVAGRVDYTPEVRERIARGWTPERRAAWAERMRGNRFCIGRRDGPEIQSRRAASMKKTLERKKNGTR